MSSAAAAATAGVRDDFRALAELGGSEFFLHGLTPPTDRMRRGNSLGNITLTGE